MVQERIEIVVTDKGTRKVQRNVAAIGTTASKASVGLSNLQKGLIGIGAGLTLRGLQRTVDSYTDLQNALRLVTNGSRELAFVTQELLDISNDTRTALDTNADFYRRLSLATRDLNLEQNDLLKITKSVNQAIKISGTTTKEASNGLIQLSQGLSSGGLRGDELRSVLEQLPRVADIIADKLGVTRGELRALGAEFKITSDVITEGFLEAAPQLEKEFLNLDVTLGEIGLVFKNTFTTAVGELNEALGASRALVKGIKLLVINMDLLINTAATLGLTFAGIKIGGYVQGLLNARTAQVELNAAVAAGRAIVLGSAAARAAQTGAVLASALAKEKETFGNVLAAAAAQKHVRSMLLQGATAADLRKSTIRLSGALAANRAAAKASTVAQTAYTASLKASSVQTGFFASTTRLATKTVKLFTAALLRNPFTFFLSGLALATGLLISMRDQIKLGSTGIVSFGDVAGVVFDDFTRDVGKATNAFIGFSAELFGIEDFDEVVPSFDNIVRFGAASADTFVGAFVGAGDAITSFFTDTGQDAGEAFLDGFNNTNGFTGLLDNTIARTARIKQANDEATAAAAARDPLGGAVGSVLKTLEEEGRLISLNETERKVGARTLTIVNKLRSEGVKILDDGIKRFAIQRQLEENAKAAQDESFRTTIEGLEAQNALLTQSGLSQEFNNQLLQIRNQIVGEGGELDPGQEKRLQAVVLENIELANQSEILQTLNGDQERYEANLFSLDQLLKENKISQEQYNKTLRDLKIDSLEASTAVGDGFERGFLKAKESLEDFATTSENLVTNAFSAAEDAIVSFVRTGELNFDSLINSILDDLARLATQQLLLSIIGGPGANSAGGLFDGLFSASGGSVSSNQTQIVGEKGPELFVPPGPGNIVPAPQTAAIMSGATQPAPVAPEVNISVVNVQSEDEILDTLGSSAGEQMVLNIIRRNKRSVRNDIA